MACSSCETPARVGPLIWPDDGAAPPARAPAPAADTARAPHLPADFARQQREIFTELAMVNPGSPRAQALQASLEALLKQQHPEPPAADSEARPTPAAATPAQPADAERQQVEIYAELGTVNPGSPRAKQLEAQLEALLRARFPDAAQPSEVGDVDEPAPADVDESAVAVAPETLRWAAGTPPAVQRAFAALAGELRVSVAEAQAAHDAIAQAPWLPAEDFHRVMAAEWGRDYPDNLRRVAAEVQALHGPLRDVIEARMAGDTFSAELARWLHDELPALRARAPWLA
jgi:hypothetical protein